MVCEDPWHRHLNGELDSTAHGQLQEELSEPQLGKVTALLQGLCTANPQEQWRESEGTSMTFLLLSRSCRLKAQLTAEIEQVGEEERLLVEVFDGHHDGPIQAAAEGLLRAAFICYE